MKKVTEETSAGKSEARPSGLDDLIQQGARQIVQQAIEAELAALLERYDNVKTLDGRRTVIRNGYLPEREVVTAIGPVTVKVPKVRDRSGSGVSSIRTSCRPTFGSHPACQRRCLGCIYVASRPATWARR
jgi:putative transposase